MKKLDGNYKERREASEQLKNLPVNFYIHLKKHLEQQDVSMEVKLRLTKEKMFPLRAKWLHAKRMAWYREYIVEAYEKFGHKNAKWDQDVKLAFDLVLKDLDDYWYIDKYAESLERACKRAMSKGCKDPLVLYFYARASRPKWINIDYRRVAKFHHNNYVYRLSSQESPIFSSTDNLKESIKTLKKELLDFYNDMEFKKI